MSVFGRKDGERPHFKIKRQLDSRLRGNDRDTAGGSCAAKDNSNPLKRRASSPAFSLFIRPKYSKTLIVCFGNTTM